MTWRALPCLLREAKKRFGDQAVLNFLPTGAINPCRFTRRARGKRKSMYKGKAHTSEIHGLC
jgi:hypothetical protein